MITVNQCSISNDNKKMYIDAETTVGYAITSIRVWSDKNFKIFSLAKNLTLAEETNQQSIILESGELGLVKFDGIFFVEFETDAPNEECSTCPNPVMAVVTNLVSYYKCGMEMLLKASLSCGDIFSSEVCDSGDANRAMSVHLLIDGINEAIKINRFIEAINLTEKLRKICDSCSNCTDSSEDAPADCTSCGSTTIYYS